MSDTAPIEIRLIRSGEASEIASLLLESYGTAYDLSENYRADLARVEERALTQQVWVAVHRVTGQLLGTVTTAEPGRRVTDFAAPGDMDMRMLAVAPAARGRGVARALMQHCMELGRERGCSRLVLHTGEDMVLAVEFYERLGFERLTAIEQDFPYPPDVWYPVRVYSKTL